MSIWKRLEELTRFLSSSTLSGATDVIEAVRNFFSGDPELRRRVTFSVAMIALSAKMAKADGVVTQDEIRAFQRIFSVPPSEARNVERLFNLAKADIVGFESYAERIASLCGSGRKNCQMLTSVMDGLFIIARADGVLHESEGRFLYRIAQIFEIDDQHFETIMARHVDKGISDPYRVLGVERGQSLEEVRRRYRKLARENHPDRLIAQGLPEELIAIATARIAAINEAYGQIEKGLRQA